MRLHNCFDQGGDTNRTGLPGPSIFTPFHRVCDQGGDPNQFRILWIIDFQAVSLIVRIRVATDSILDSLDHSGPSGPFGEKTSSFENIAALLQHAASARHILPGSTDALLGWLEMDQLSCVFGPGCILIMNYKSLQPKVISIAITPEKCRLSCVGGGKRKRVPGGWVLQGIHCMGPPMSFLLPMKKQHL